MERSRQVLAAGSPLYLTVPKDTGNNAEGLRARSKSRLETQAEILHWMEFMDGRMEYTNNLNTLTLFLVSFNLFSVREALATGEYFRALFPSLKYTGGIRKHAVSFSLQVLP